MSDAFTYFLHYFVLFHTKQRCRLKLDDSVIRKKAGGGRRTEAFAHTHSAFTQRSLYTKDLFAYRRLYTKKSVFQQIWYLQCFVPLRFKNIGICSIFCFFSLLPQKTSQHFCPFRKLENHPKNVSKRHFFPSLGTLQTGVLLLLETLMSHPDSGQKAHTHPHEGVLVFFGARRRRVGGLGRPSP